LGGTLALIGLPLKVIRRNQYIPFGPFLNMGGFLTILLLLRNPEFIESLFGFPL
jgi:prepilin signal peptidase PulO-like enzyme (type II secretory pathway)